MKDVTPPPNKIPWPPIVYLTAICIAYFVETLWGKLWFTNTSSNLITGIGIVIVMSGLALDFYSIFTLRKHNTTVMPTKAASNLVTSGPFAFSRNPIYLGNTIITVGFALTFHSYWYLLLGLLAAFITNEVVIKKEELHLHLMFKDQWENYIKKVRRWI